MTLRTIEERLHEDAVNKLRRVLQVAARQFESALGFDYSVECTTGVYDADGKELSLVVLLRHLVNLGVTCQETCVKNQAISDFIAKVLNPQDS